MRPGRHGDFAAGLIALAVAGTGIYLAFGGGLPWGGPHEVRAVVASANGLEDGAPVRVAGVQVGRVTSVARGPGATAVLTIGLDDAAPALHTDATLKVRPRTFLEGNFFVDLRPGTPAAPRLDAGGTIPLAQTAGPVQIDEVLSALDRPTRDSLGDLLEASSTALDGGGAEGLRGAAIASSDAFGAGAVLARAARGERAGDLAAAVDAGGRTLAAVARDERRVAELVTGFDRTMRALAGRRRELGDSLRELAALLRAAPSDLARIGTLTPAARSFAAMARPALRVAPRTLRLALPALEEVRALVAPAALPRLLTTLDPALREAARLEPRLVRLADVVRPVAECVRDNAVPTLTQAVSDPPHTTGAPVYLEFLSSLVGLTSASQNFDGNGPVIRYHAGLGEQAVTTGSLPGVHAPLVGLASEPVLGSRPAYPGHLPPLRPDVRCAGQRLPDLRAETGPAPARPATGRAP